MKAMYTFLSKLKKFLSSFNQTYSLGDVCNILMPFLRQCLKRIAKPPLYLQALGDFFLFNC